MDVTETAIERPKKTVNILFSQEKKHSLKMQAVINQESKQIICLNFGLGIATISACLKKAMFISIPQPIVYKIVAIKG